MGRGNFYPSTDNAFAMVYVSIDYDQDEELQGYFYEDLVDNILGILPKSFHFVKDKWVNKETKILAENNLARVVIADNESSYAVCITVPDDCDYFSLANIYIQRYGAKILKRLPDFYDLYCRTSAWTSEKLTKDSPKHFYIY